MNWEPIKQGLNSAAASVFLFLRTNPVFTGWLCGFLLGVFFCVIIH